MHFFRASSLVAASILFGIASVNAQEVASLPDDLPVLTTATVLGPCQRVAADPDLSDPVDGICISATRDHLGLASTYPAADLDAHLTDLVVELASLPIDGECNAFDAEIAAAINETSAYLSDEEQANRVIDIADTIAACAGENGTGDILVEDSASDA